MLLLELPLRPPHVLVLVVELRLVLPLDVVLPQVVDRALLLGLKVVGQLVVTHQHRVGGLQLRLTLVKFLEEKRTTFVRGKDIFDCSVIRLLASLSTNGVAPATFPAVPKFVSVTEGSIIPSNSNKTRGPESTALPPSCI